MNWKQAMPSFSIDAVPGTHELVAAIVLTHNRRDALELCLDALRRQTRSPDFLIVVDNGSSDGTSAYLAKQSDLITVRLTTNSGSAGGFKAGLDEAARTPADWWWVMDDDCTPMPNSLDHLYTGCHHDAHRLGGVAPMVRFTDGTTRCGFTWAHGIVQFDGRQRLPIDWAPFLGMLLRADACRAVGPVRSDFFMWHDDAEYCLRLQRHGWRLACIPSAEFMHPADTPSSDRRLFGRNLVYPTAPPWKQYYSARNGYVVAQMIYTTWFGRIKSLLVYIAREFKYLALLATSPRTNRKRAWMRIRGLVDGVFGRMGGRVSPETNQLLIGEIGV